MTAINNNIKKLMMFINNAEERNKSQIEGVLCPIAS